MVIVFTRLNRNDLSKSVVMNLIYTEVSNGGVVKHLSYVRVWLKEEVKEVDGRKQECRKRVFQTECKNNNDRRREKRSSL